MRLLVSVAAASEAPAALEGGADLVDAKDPAQGPLGPVRLEVLRAIVAASRGRPVSAALGDAEDGERLARLAGDFVRAGAEIVKLGFPDHDEQQVMSLTRAAADEARRSRAGAAVAAVVYVDRLALTPFALASAAAKGGAAGLLLDTADKTGPGLFSWMPTDDVARLVNRVHALGLWVALAGRLAEHDVTSARETGADVVGVRGAACRGGRLGLVDADRVRRLCTLCRETRRPVPVQLGVASA